MTRILALDLATKSGASVDALDGSIVTAWIDLSAGLKKPTHGDLYAACDGFVTALIDEHQPEAVVCEEQIYRGKGSRLLGGYKAIVQLACARRSIRFVDELNAAKACELALGNGGLSKRPPPRSRCSISGSRKAFARTRSTPGSSMRLLASG